LPHTLTSSSVQTTAHFVITSLNIRTGFRGGELQILQSK
jgi:hypothetical protein